MVYVPNFRLDGQVALVTGAGRGLGRHIALAVAESGARVAAVARNAADLDAVAATAREIGVEVVPFVCDVSRVEDHAGLVETVEERLGPIDILVNNAGTNIQQDALDVDVASWDAVFDLNMRATFFLSQAVARRMVAEKRSGRMVNLASQMAAVGFYKRAAYAASKGGVVQMSKVLALEWATHGIRVNCVGPTFVDTPLAQRMFEDADIKREVIRRIPIGRLGEASEVAAAVIYLLSEGADLVTGHHLLVDGGWTAQ